MTLQELAALLIQQSTPSPNYIALSDKTLQQTGISDLIKENLLRSDGVLYLVVDPTTIPTNPPATGFSLNAQTPSISSDSFLNLASRDVTINFTGDNNQINFTMTVALNESGGQTVGWVFSDSYSELTGLPFDQLELPSPEMIFVTATGGSTPQGLNFQSSFALNSLFQQITDLLGSGNAQLSDGRSFAELQSSDAAPYVLAGAIMQSDQGVSFDLQANLNVPSFNIGTFFEMTQLFAGASQKWVKNSDGNVTNVLTIYLGAYVSLENSSGTSVNLDLRALMPITNQSPMMSLAVLPQNPFDTTLGNIGSLVGGQSWDDFFSGPASSIGALLNNFGFTSFITNFSLSSFSVTSISLGVGTLQPWPLFSPLQSMTLTIDWMILFTSSNNIQTLTIDAVFQLTDTISFDVEVVLPDMTITGIEHGPATTLTLSQISQQIFGSNFGIPDELLTFSFSDLSIGIDYNNKIYSFGATASLDFNLFGTQILALTDMVLNVVVNTSASPTSYTANLNGFVSLGPITFAANATLSNTEDTVFELHLVDETIGSMLNHFVHLVDPTFDISFPSPWNGLFDISLDAFLLKVNVTKKTVSLTYPTSINLGFIDITGISLTYSKSNTSASSVQIEVSGSFLGQNFGQGGQPPLAWDAINQQPPAVPGGGSSYFDLQYLGLGQHITFTDLDKMTDMQAVITALRNSVIPLPGNTLPAFGKNGLAFSQDSNWLVGAQFTIINTFSLAIIFNDPNLYGLLISLAGTRAGSFAGLSFQILYRKITDDIGVYHIELKLPDAMRNLQFGEVSITLPVVVIDIYTNGNFRIDMGFPNGLDFSNSFCLQVLPFIGYGGFYFALLNGQTSTRVPKITNGDFNPVIEFGVGLSIGVGKTVNEGILSGGISVTVVGIVEGVIGWFNPNDSSVKKDVYYWIQGTIAIVGKLYATIDFAIIKASVDVTAYASVTLVIEAYQPIYISLSAGVSVRVSVKVVFFTIHLSFSATIKASFTIGSASQPPWQVASGSGNNVSALRMHKQAALPQLRGQNALPQLRGQDTLHRQQQTRFAGLTTALRTQRMMLMAQSLPPLNWTPIAVFPSGAIQEIDLYALPAFTKSPSSASGVDSVLLFSLENSINPLAATHAEQIKLFGDAPETTEFNLLLEGMLIWAINSKTGNATQPNATVTADDLAFIKCQLTDPAMVQTAFNYTNLSSFFTLNYQFELQAPPESSSEMAVTVFPVFPALTLTTNDDNNVNIPFYNWPQPNQADELYQEKIDTYFQLLQVQFDQGTAPQSDSGCSANQSGQSPQDQSVSMATVVLEQYFAILAKSAVQAAIDEMETFTFINPTGAAYGIQDVISDIGDTTITPEQIVTPNQSTTNILNTGALLTFNKISQAVLYQIKFGDSFASIAKHFSDQGALDSEGNPLSAADIIAANVDTGAIFNAGTDVSFSGITYTTQDGDTLNLIAARFLVRAEPVSQLQQIANLVQITNDITNANPDVHPDSNGLLTPGTQITIPGADNGSTSPVQSVIYTTVEGDTYTLIAAYLLAIQQGAVSFPTFVALIVKANQLQVTDPTADQPVGISINIPPVARTIQSGDRISSLAVTLITNMAVIQSSLLAVPSTANLLAPQGVLNMPLLQYKIASGDTLGGIAQTFNLSLDQLAQQIADTPSIFASSASITVSQVETIEISTLINSLLTQGEWNNIAGMTSRFMLNGLRLPDPNDSYFENLTVEELQDPKNLAAVVTQPMYWLTGQQFPVDNPPPDGYKITLTNTQQVSWIVSAPNTELTDLAFGLTADQITLISNMASTPFAPQIQTLTRLELFQMSPSRFSLQNHLNWQAAALPAGSCISNPSQATGAPTIWVFPDSLVSQLSGSGDDLLKYQTVVGTHEDATRPMVISDVRCYNWATMLDLTISLPPNSDGPSTSVSNTYVMLGADQNGRDLLQAVYQHITTGNDDAELFLLYSPDPTSANPSGLNSDSLNPTQTFLLKTNLSTLSHSGPTPMMLARASVADDSDDATYSATLQDAADFIKLLWEDSIVYSGGYYLNYDNVNGNVGLPAQLFSQGSTATLSLLVLLKSQMSSSHPPIYTFNNCVVIGDNIDASQANVFVQPVTYITNANDTLTVVANYYNSNFGGNLSAADVANLNADIPLLLQIGAEIAISGTQNYQIEYGDTLKSIADGHGLSVSALIGTGNNAQATILAVGAQMQFASGILQPTATVPPGNVGFELTCTNPDPSNLPYSQLTPQQVVNSLFHLFGYSIDGTEPVGGNPGFVASGVGLPTGPTESNQDGSDGLTARDLTDTVSENWNYTQTVAVAPFATSAQGSLSPALPPAVANPYAGIGAKNEVTLNFIFQDIYGNQQPAPGGYNSLNIPVGYYDDIIAISRWPGLAASYLVAEGTQPQIQINFTTQINKYLPSSSVTVASALKTAGGDGATYMQVYYQIQQSDLGFALETSLNQTSINSNPPVYPISPETPFTSFVNSALIFLSAIQTLQQFVYTTQSGDTVQNVVNDFGVTAAQLFDANGDQAYSALFGTAPLNVPVMYVTVQGDSLSSISSTHQQTSVELATNNSTVDLNPGADLSAQNRPYVTHNGYTLQQIAAEWRCTVEGIAEANHGTSNIITPNTTMTVSGVSYTTNANDTFDSIVTAFAGLQITLTISELAEAISQSVPGIFIDGVTIAINDIVVQQGDSSAQPSYTVSDNTSLAQIAAQLNRSVVGIALANHNIPGILNQSVKLSAFGASVPVSATDTFDTIASALSSAAGMPVTVPDVAVQNQSLASIFVEGSILQVTQLGDTFEGLAATYAAKGFSIDALATDNSSLQNIFASGTALFITSNQVPAEASDTLSSYARNNGVSTDQLAQYNSDAVFVTGATLGIPYLVTNTSQSQYATYTAQSGDILQGISGKFANANPTMLATLNQDLHGLFAPGQKITDPNSGKFVTTQASDTFNSIITEFAGQSVTLSLEQLASIITAQQNLLQAGGIWVTPVMTAANSNGGSANTLSGLAAKYNLDVARLGEANSAAHGFLASGVSLTFQGQTVVTQASDTFNSLVNRFAQLGLITDAATLITAFENVNNLLNPSSLVVPLPANTTTTVSIDPNFSDPVFELTVDIVMRRNIDYIDPDFTNVQSVSTARTSVSPEPNPTGNDAGLSLTEFASAFQQAMPGLYVATGASVGEFDSASARRMWVANFGYNVGEHINYQFANGSNLQYFALPPLSTSLISGNAQIQSYASGQGLSGAAENIKFQAVDLDVWAQTFLTAVDLFLSPSYAVPAYQLGMASPPSPPLLTAYDNVITQKQKLAESISEQLQYILQISGTPDPNDLADAKATLKQALLVELGSAYSVNSLIQSQVNVNSKYTNEDLAPRLSGKPVTSLGITGASNAAPIVITSPGHNLATGAQVMVAGVQGNTAANGQWVVTVIDTNNFSLNGSNGTNSQPYVAGTGTVIISMVGINDYSLSNAKVPLVNGTERATFLLTVKSPADNAQANLALRYVINELEIPESNSIQIGDYQASSWLTFILPIDTAASTIGASQIPIPLRAYPPPVTLLDQRGRQSVKSPSTPEELADWDYRFTYQHLDADQDTTSIKVQFNTGAGTSMMGSNGSAFFQALAQFMYVYPQLKVDLALLPTIAPGTTNDTALVAINTFSELVSDIAEAWGGNVARLALAAGPSPQVFEYTLQRAKNTANPPQLTTLTVTAGADNPAELWPKIKVSINGEFTRLTLQSSSASQAIYDYPSGVMAEAPIQQRLIFDDMNVFDRQDGWAGVSITRNADLITGTLTNTNFVYQTPITGFSSVATPFVYGVTPIDIKSTTTTTLAQGLGQFFQSLLTGDPASQRSIKVSCDYGYQMAGANAMASMAGLSQSLSLRANDASNAIVAFMPVLLVPSYNFQLGTDWNWQDANSFVSQLAAAVTSWNDSNKPATTNGAFFFDISIYSTMIGAVQTPLVEATEVRYVMPLV